MHVLKTLTVGSTFHYVFDCTKKCNDKHATKSLISHCGLTRNDLYLYRGM